MSSSLRFGGIKEYPPRHRKPEPPIPHEELERELTGEGETAPNSDQLPALSVVVIGPDGQRFENVTALPAMEVNKFAQSFAWERYRSPQAWLLVSRASDDGYVHLRGDATLRDSGVEDGDVLHLNPAYFAAGEIQLVAEFLAAAITSGIAGNAAYDLLKSALARIRKKRKQGRPTLSREDVRDIAVGCCTVKLDLYDPATIRVTEVFADRSCEGVGLLASAQGAACVLLFIDPEADPDQIEVEIQMEKGSS